MFTYERNSRISGATISNGVRTTIPNDSHKETTLVKDYAYKETKGGNKGKRNQVTTREDKNGYEILNDGLILRNIIRHTTDTELVVEFKIFAPIASFNILRGLEWMEPGAFSYWVSNAVSNSSRKITFNNCIFDSLTFRYSYIANCTFNNCEFVNCELMNKTSFSNCTFKDCLFTNLSAHGNIYEKVTFISCIFDATVIEYSTTYAHAINKCEYINGSKVIFKIPASMELVKRGNAQMTSMDIKHSLEYANVEPTDINVKFRDSLGVDDALEIVKDYTLRSDLYYRKINFVTVLQYPRKKKTV